MPKTREEIEAIEDPFERIMELQELEDAEREKEPEEAAEPEPEPEKEPEPEQPPAEEPPPAAAAESEPKPVTIEELRERAERAEREAEGVRRDLFRQRERTRIAEEQARLARMSAEGEEDGRIKVTPKVDPETGEAYIDEEDIAEVLSRRQQRQPQQPNYAQIRERVVAEVGAGAAEAAAELEKAYQWLDQQVGEKCREAGISPNQLGGFDGLIRFLDGEGLTDAFEQQYPGVPMERLIRAPLSGEDGLRSMLRGYMRQRPAARQEREDQPAQRTTRRLPSERGPVMRPSRGRGDKHGTSLLDTDPTELFTMSDEDFKEREKRSLELLNKEG